MPIELHEDARDRDRARELARRYDNHPIDDMLYVGLAERLDLPLLTLDEKLHVRSGHLGRLRRPGEAVADSRRAGGGEADSDPG